MTMTTGEQPWVPAGHLTKLVVGARVQVNINGECECVWDRNSAADRAGLRGHMQQEHGAVGRINLIGGCADHMHHPFSVKFLHPFAVPEMAAVGMELVTGGCYAAIELIPLDTEADR